MRSWPDPKKSGLKERVGCTNKSASYALGACFLLPTSPWLEPHSGAILLWRAHMRMRTIRRALVLATALNGVAALSMAQTAQKPAFEVASIKEAVFPSDAYFAGW